MNRKGLYLISLSLLVGLWAIPIKTQASASSLSIIDEAKLTFKKNRKIDSVYIGDIKFKLAIDSKIKNICAVNIANLAKGETVSYINKKNCDGKIADIVPKSVTFTQLEVGERKNRFVADITYKDSPTATAKTEKVFGPYLTLTASADGKTATARVDTTEPTATPPEPSVGGSDRTKLGDLGDKDKQLTARLREDDTIKNLWKVMLRLSDTFVALFFLLVAFATILHINYDTYGVKKAIMPLFLGIILAHFSLVIIQYFADFSQSLTAGFLNGAAINTPGCPPATIEENFACNLAATLFKGGLQSLNPTVVTVVGGAVISISALVALFAFIPGVSLGLLGFGGLAIALVALIAILIPTLLIIAMAFLLYIRSYIIIFLAIISPIAWLTIMWTPVQGFFKKWWSQFTVWIFMAPICLFFVWLAIEFYNQTKPDDANFGTYLLTLVMLYLAISAPFKMGGAIMAAWGGFGKKAGVTGGKYLGGLGSAQLERLSQTQLGQKLGINSPRAVFAGFKQHFDEQDATRKALAESEARGMASQGVVTSLTQGPRDIAGWVGERTGLGVGLRQSRLTGWIGGGARDRRAEANLRTRGARNTQLLQERERYAQVSDAGLGQLVSGRNQRVARAALLEASRRNPATYNDIYRQYENREDVQEMFSQYMNDQNNPSHQAGWNEHQEIMDTADRERVRANDPVSVQNSALRQREISRWATAQNLQANPGVIQNMLINSSDEINATVTELRRIYTELQQNRPVRAGNTIYTRVADEARIGSELYRFQGYQNPSQASVVAQGVIRANIDGEVGLRGAADLLRALNNNRQLLEAARQRGAGPEINAIEGALNDALRHPNLT